MNKKDRVLAAISHQQVDHVPASFSLHFPREIASGEAAVKAHIDFYRETDCDVLKIMNENLVPEIGEMNGPDDWKKIPAYNRHSPFMVRQLDMIKRILDGVGEPVYALATVHGICASAIHPIEERYGYVPVREMMARAPLPEQNRRAGRFPPHCRRDERSCRGLYRSGLVGHLLRRAGRRKALLYG